jgi:L,D-peptidoglycan transpeptidase YkuD (ErfK/YbiS/YcfS/YnhG family)
MLSLFAGNRTFMKSGLAVLLVGLLSASNAYAQKITAQRLHQLTVQEHPALLTAQQLIIVWQRPGDSLHHAWLTVWERKGTHWKKIKHSVRAAVGKNGIAVAGTKIEGDGKTPAGWYNLGRLFSYLSTVSTSLPVTQLTKADKWIDDPASPAYNQYVRGETTAASYENLLLKSDDYKYCMVIEYNTQPVVSGKGSAIFFHLSNPEMGPTAGCVAIPEKHMLPILQWMQPNQQRVIWILNGSTDFNKKQLQ